MARVYIRGIFVALLLAATSLADEAVWVGPATGDWKTAANWSTGVVPGFNTAARIDDNPNQNTRVEWRASVASPGMLSIDAGDTLAVINSQFGVSRPLILDGTISVEGNGASFGATLVVNSNGELKLAGTSATGATATTVGLFNNGNIHGSGLLSLGTSTTTTPSWNETTIRADNPTIPLSIATPGAANFENDGTLVASDGGKLQIVRGTNGTTTDFGVLGGRIEAYAKSTVSIGSTQLNGGGYVENSVLAIMDDNDSTTAAPMFQFYSAELKNVTLQGKFAMGGASIIGSLTNQTDLSPSAATITSGGTWHNTAEGDVVLNGGGTISLGFDQYALFGAQTNPTTNRLINVDNLIHGSGELAVSWYGFTNRSVVQADAGQNKELYFYNGLSQGQLINSGVMKAINGGRLRLGYSSGNTSQMKNFEGGTAGQIIAEQNSSVLLNTIQIQGGVLRTVGADAATRGKFIAEPGVVLQDVTLDGTFRLQSLAGVLSTITLVNKNYNTGSLTSRFNVTSNTSAEIAGAGDIISESGTFLTLGQSSTFTNDDNVIHGVGTIVANGFTTTSIVNRGTFRAEGGTFAFYNQQPVTNSGLLDAATGATLTLPTFGTVTNYEGGVGGTIHAAIGGVVNVDNVDGGTLATDGTGLIKVSGYIKDLHNTGTIQMATSAPPQGTIVNDGVISNSMNLTGTFVRFDGSGTWQGAGGSFGSGTVENGPHHTILGVGDIGNTNTTGVFVNQGTLRTSDTTTNAFRIYAGSFQNSGLVHAPAGKTLAINSLFARASNSGTLQAEGNMSVTSSSGLFNESGGVIDVRATLTLTQTRLRNRAGGTISGNGQIAGPITSGPLVVNEGTADPGPGVATLTIGDDFQQLGTGQLKIDVSGGSTLSNDLLQVNGTASLAGNLIVSHLGSEALVVGNAFTLVAATGGVTGMFGQVTMPTLDPSLFWYLDYEATSVRALVADVIPGDFNRNGSVGSEDFVWWRENGGTEQQYDDWRGNFGRTIDLGAGMSAAQVPEPAGGLLLVTCGALVSATRRIELRHKR